MTPSSRGSLPWASPACRKRSHVRHEHLPPAGQGGQRAEPAGEEHTVNKFPIFNNNSCSKSRNRCVTPSTARTFATRRRRRPRSRPPPPPPPRGGRTTTRSKTNPARWAKLRRRLTQQSKKTLLNKKIFLSGREEFRRQEEGRGQGQEVVRQVGREKTKKKRVSVFCTKSLSSWFPPQKKKPCMQEPSLLETEIKEYIASLNINQRKRHL